MFLFIQHFREDPSLSEKLENLIENATNHPQLTASEKNAAMEVKDMYQMQKDGKEELSEVMQLKLSREPVHLVQW